MNKLNAFIEQTETIHIISITNFREAGLVWYCKRHKASIHNKNRDQKARSHHILRSIVLKVLVTAIRQYKETEGTQIGKEDGNLSTEN